jgi:two-component system sensor histidine kinase KdpD
MSVVILPTKSHATRAREVLSAIADGIGSAAFARLLQALALVGMVTGLLLSATSVVRLDHVSIVYLVPVLIAATCWGTLPAVVSAMAGIAAPAFFFYPPLYDLRVSNPQHLVDLCLFISVALVTSHLAERTRAHVRRAQEREEEMRGLYAFSRRLAAASTAQDILSAVREHLSRLIGRRAFLLGHPVEAGRPAQAVDAAGVPEAVRSHIAQRPPGAAGTCCVDDPAGSTWLVGAVSASNPALGMLAVEIGRAPADTVEASRQRMAGVLADAAATIERLDLARALDEANARANRDAVREALIGSVSHELRTPLSSILGAASVLSQAGAVVRDRRLAELAAVIREEAERLDGDIQNLLDASRVSGKGVRAQCTWSDPADLVNAALERHRPSGHDIAVALPDDLPLVRVDPVLVEQALRQIVDNAAKYSPAGSGIAIAATKECEGIAVRVCDRGAGLTEEDKSRLFERFYRGSRHRATVPGSGLGLSIARAFIGASGGRLDVESAGPGQGTTVSVWLPAPPPSADRSSEDDGDA